MTKTIQSIEANNAYVNRAAEEARRDFRAQVRTNGTESQREALRLAELGYGWEDVWKRGRVSKADACMLVIGRVIG
jgi:hypothetical protein